MEWRSFLRKHIAGLIGLFVAVGIVLAAVAGFGTYNEDKSIEEPGQQQDISSANPDSETQKAKEYVELLQIEVENIVTGASKAVGTGVVYQVEEKGVWIATAAHVLHNKSDEERILLNLANAWIECTTWLEMEDTDLAYLYLPQRDIATELVMVPVKTDKISYDALKAGAIVQASGFCEGKLTNCAGMLIENWIYVEDFAQHMMLAECEVKHGMSGGGLYDAEGRFLGMICGGNEEGELVAVPWHVMQARFEENCKAE